MDILIIDDHPIIHEVLGAIARNAFPEARLHFAMDLNEAYAHSRGAQGLDVVILDLGLPNCTGIEALSRFRTIHPDVPILVVSACDDRETVMKAMRSGAAGYVPKSAKPQVIAGALRVVAAGQIYVPPIAIADIFKVPAPAQNHRLTERQRDVMRLVLKGLANKEIARELTISENTVKQHLQSVYSYFGVSSRAQAVLAATRTQLKLD